MNLFGYVTVFGLPIMGAAVGGLPGLFVGLLLSIAFCRAGGF